MRTMRLSTGSGIQGRLLTLRIFRYRISGVGLLPVLLLCLALLAAPVGARGKPPARSATPPALPGDASAPGWTNPFPSDLTTISAVSGDEAWAGGSNSYLLHFVGGTATVAQAPDNYGSSGILGSVNQ